MPRSASTATSYYDRSIYQRLRNEVEQTPPLQPGEDITLVRAWRDRQDKKAFDRIVDSHRRLALKYARGYEKGYGIPVEDLFQQGCIGLIIAAKKFDPARNVMFATYATWWIRSNIQMYILHNWSQVRLPLSGAARKLFFGLNQMRRKIGSNIGPLSPEDAEKIATALEVPVKAVLDMNDKTTGRDMSLQAPLNGESDMTFGDILEADDPTPEEAVAERQMNDQYRALVEAALEILKPRDRDIVRRRRLQDEPETLQEVADIMGITRERVRQIEKKSLLRIERFIVREHPEKVKEIRRKPKPAQLAR